MSPPPALDLEYRQPTRPRLLVGVGVAVVSSLGWLGERTPVTWATSLLLALCALYLVVTGRRRRGCVRVDPALHQVTSTLPKTRVERAERVELQLGRGDLLGLPRPSFAAVVVSAENVRHPIYESGDPNDLLRWARRLDEVLPVRVGWVAGQPRMLEWLQSGAGVGDPVAQAETIHGASHGGQRRVSQLLFGITAALGVAWGLFLTGSEVRPAPLSVALALGTLAFVLLTAALVATDFVTISVGKDVVVERRRLGLVLRRLAVPRTEVLRAEALTADGHSPVLLLVTERDVWSVPLAQPAATQAARALGPPPAPRSPGENFSGGTLP